MIFPPYLLGFFLSLLLILKSANLVISQIFLKEKKITLPSVDIKLTLPVKWKSIKSYWDTYTYTYRIVILKYLKGLVDQNVYLGILNIYRFIKLIVSSFKLKLKTFLICFHKFKPTKVNNSSYNQSPGQNVNKTGGMSACFPRHYSCRTVARNCLFSVRCDHKQSRVIYLGKPWYTYYM